MCEPRERMADEKGQKHIHVRDVLQFVSFRLSR
jgi:hypothetical protein